MKVLVLLRMVPDVVEELEIARGRAALDPGTVSLILSESDSHALEQALLLKESRGASVTALALDSPATEEALFSALAKGADEAIKIRHSEESLTTRRMASIFAAVIEAEPELKSAALILTGVRTIADLDGLLAPVLAHRMGLPHLGLVSRLSLDPSGRIVTAIREYPDGVRGEFEVQVPAVLGIQAAERPPRYVPVGRLREAMKTRSIKCIASPALDEAPIPSFQVREMRRPRASAHAEMLTGTNEATAAKLRDILVGRGLL